MSYANGEMKRTVCDVCDHEKMCFVQYENGEEQAVCPDCLRLANRD